MNKIFSFIITNFKKNKIFYALIFLFLSLFFYFILLKESYFLESIGEKIIRNFKDNQIQNLNKNFSSFEDNYIINENEINNLLYDNQNEITEIAKKEKEILEFLDEKINEIKKIVDLLKEKIKKWINIKESIEWKQEFEELKGKIEDIITIIEEQEKKEYTKNFSMDFLNKTNDYFDKLINIIWELNKIYKEKFKYDLWL